MKFFNYVVIAQSALIFILFFCLVLHPKKEDNVNYDAIRKQNEQIIQQLKEQMEHLQYQNKIIALKIDTLKIKIPKQKEKFNIINEKINSIKDNIQIYNYTDSSDQYLINRLSQ
tara:strand:+ start:300 stop:641 length:342 start_codon:yes stop_codon:yes gene_type:complete